VLSKILDKDNVNQLVVDSSGAASTKVKESALPTGAATAAKQDALAVLIGALTDAVVTDPTASGSEIALLKGIIKQLQGTSGTVTPISLSGATVAVPVDLQYNQLTDAEALPVTVSGSKTGKQASDTITLAHDVGIHSALDVLSTAAGEVLEFASLGEAGDLIAILGLRYKYAANAIPTACAGYRLHLYNASPTAIADNATYNLPSGDLAKYIGSIFIPIPTDLGDECHAQVDNINLTAKLVGTGLFGILSCVGAETPAIDTVITIIINTMAV